VDGESEAFENGDEKSFIYQSIVFISVLGCCSVDDRQKRIVSFSFMKTILLKPRQCGCSCRIADACQMVFSQFFVNAPNYFQIEGCSPQICILLRLNNHDFNTIRKQN